MQDSLVGIRMKMGVKPTIKNYISRARKSKAESTQNDSSDFVNLNLGNQTPSQRYKKVIESILKSGKSTSTSRD